LRPKYKVMLFAEANQHLHEEGVGDIRVGNYFRQS
jgi:hypothetical protein